MNNNENKKHISNAVIKRLPRYFRYLRELIKAGIMRVSSKELADKMGTTASQIRQDLNCFGGFGQQGYGYNVKYLYNEISHILGVDCHFSAIIVGIGNLGKALATNPLFEKRGVKITGLFDIDEHVIGKTYEGITVMDSKKMCDFCKNNNIDIAILTTPKSVAYETALKLAKTGVKGILNFSNAELKLEDYPNLHIENVHLGDPLMVLCYEIAKDKNS